MPLELFDYSRGGAYGLYCFDSRVEFLCTYRLRIRGKPAHAWHSGSWHPYCRSFRNEIWKLLFSWPEFGVFINGSTVKGFAEPGPVFRNRHSLVGAAASGRCEGSTIISVLPHHEWRLHSLKTCSLKLTKELIHTHNNYVERVHYSRTVTGLYVLKYSLILCCWCVLALLMCISTTDVY